MVISCYNYKSYREGGGDIMSNRYSTHVAMIMTKADYRTVTDFKTRLHHVYSCHYKVQHDDAHIMRTACRDTVSNNNITL